MKSRLKRSGFFRLHLMRMSMGVLLLAGGLATTTFAQEQMKIHRSESRRVQQPPPQRDSLFDILSFWHPNPLTMQHPRQSLPSQFTIWNLPEKIDLDSPWRLELARKQGNHTMEMILGTIEMAGVGYIAYEHVKKYGWDGSGN